MNTKVLLGCALLTSGSALAADPMPKICRTVANYAAATMQLRTSDGTFADAYDPGRITLTRSFKRFPIMSVNFLGNCDESATKLKQSWCSVAGGSPNVYEVEVGEPSGGTAPIASVVVTYNRGGCWVDEVIRK